MRDPENDEEGVQLPEGIAGIEEASDEEIEELLDGFEIEYDEEAIENENVAHSEHARHWLTNDAIGVLLLGSFPIILAAGSSGFLDLGMIPREIVAGWLMLLILAGVWAFGSEGAEVYCQLRGRGSDGR